MATTLITGVKAAIDGLQCIRRFKIMLTAVDTKAACSASNGAVFRGVGNKDWVGIVDGYGIPTKNPGDKFTFTGSDRDGSGWSSSADGAIVSRVKVVAPVITGRYSFYRMWIAANGPLTPGAYAASDSSTPNPVSASDASLSLATGELEAFELDLIGNLTRPAYLSGNSGWPRRDLGNVDAELKYSQKLTDAGGLPAINSYQSITATLKTGSAYTLQWMQILGVEPDYPIEGSDPGVPEYVSAEVTARFSAYYNGAAGTITTPNGAWWPPA